MRNATLRTLILLVSMVVPSSLSLAQSTPDQCLKNQVRNASGRCVCKPGYAGATCTQCAPNHYAYPACRYCLASSTCSGHGLCSLNGTCTCNAGWSGTRCNLAATPASSASATPATPTPPTAPSLLVPENAVNPAKLEWTEPTSWGTGGTSATYKLYLNDVVMMANIPRTTPYYVPSNLTSGVWSYRVVADNGVLSTPSETRHFVVVH